MTKLDTHILDTIARSQTSHAPPPGAEARMLAQFHAQIGPGGGGDLGGGDLGISTGGLSTGGQLLHAIKIVSAVVGLTAAGLGGVWAVGSATRGPDARHRSATSSSAPVEASAPTEHPRSTSPSLPTAAPSEAPETLSPTPSSPAAPEPHADPAGSRPRPLVKPAAGSPTLAAELKLIQAARQAAPAEALTLLDRHVQEFRDGELTHERESLRVIALCDLGQLTDAQRASERFLALEPGALLAARVRTGCANKISLPATDPGVPGNGSL